MTLVIAPGVEDTNKSNAKPIQGDTILVYLVDRSYSMTTCWEETVGGLNRDVEVQQKDDDGQTEVAFYFFDGGRSHGLGGGMGAQTNLVKPYEGPLNEAMVLDQHDQEYSPRGNTPLYDSVGRMIVELRERVDATDNKVNVIISIFTDGENNGHHGYSAQDVKTMIQELEQGGWTFTYFGANQDAWAVGQTFGIAKGNTMSYDTSNMADVMATASVARSAHTRLAKTAFAAGQDYVTQSYFADVGQSEEDYGNKK